jgi:DNA modification methylase
VVAWRVIVADVLDGLAQLPDQSVNTCVTSPPYYGLRDYGVDGQIGLEQSPQEYLANMVAVIREVRRVLRDDGTCWVNMGDTYAHNGACGGGSPVDVRKPEYGRGTASGKWQGRETDRSAQERQNYRVPDGMKAKDLLGMPWSLALALRADGWYLRQDIIWHKPNPMPESVRDRCTKAHEYIFLLSKKARYYFDHEAIKEPAEYAGKMRGGSTNRYEQNSAGMDCRVYDTRNRRSVWTVTPKPYKEAHFATFPPDLIRPCILAGCPEGGTVLDPFVGSGTTLQVATEEGRDSIGIELNPEYAKLIEGRMAKVQPKLGLEEGV